MIATCILRCGDGSYYVGCSRNVENRLWQHSTGHGGDYTAKRQPVDLVYLEEFDRIDWAYAREKQLQGWSRKKREALIEQRIQDLPALSRKVFGRWTGFRYAALRLLNPLRA